MLKRFAPLVPLALVTLLFGCAAHTPVSQQVTDTQVQKSSSSHSSALYQEELATEKELAQFSANSKPYELPALADSILERGMSLIGTRYRFGGTSEAGFDCSGFIGYLFKEEAGMQLPRSTREMINVNAPLVARNNLNQVICCSSAPLAVGASATPGFTWAMTSLSTPAAAAAVVYGSIAWVTATGTRPLWKPSVPWRWRQPA